MKIAIVINTSWNIYNFRMGLIKQLLKDGNEVLAVAPKDAFSNLLKLSGCKFIPIEIDNTGSNPLKDLKLLYRLRNIYSKYNPDIIYHFTVKPNIYGTLAAYLCRIPMINNVSGLGTVFLSNGVSSVIAKWLYKVSFVYANLVFFQNEDDRHEFQSQIRLPNLVTDLLPGSGIDLSKFCSKRPISKGEITFIMIARLIIEKGVVEYLNAAKEVKREFPRVKILLVGKLEDNHLRGIDISMINEYESMGIVKYLGEVDNIIPHIESCTCVVLPSYREGTPRTLLEAAALSRPIITTDVPGCKETVTNHITGLLCKVRDTKSLEQSMKIICNMSREDLIEMGMRGRQMIEKKFDEKIVIQKYLKHTSNIMNKIPS